MAISIDWDTKIIFVPQSDLTFVSGVVYELDLNVFRAVLNALQASEAGQPFPTTHQHNTTVTVSGVTLARVVEVINGYTVTFEDGQYAVNLVGANSNISEVTNVNQVSIRSFNTAGLVVATDVAAVIGSIADAVWDETLADHQIVGTTGKSLKKVQSTVIATLGMS